eukprot:7225614-Prymnesium_polylepis.1
MSDGDSVRLEGRDCVPKDGFPRRSVYAGHGVRVLCRVLCRVAVDVDWHCHDVGFEVQPSRPSEAPARWFRRWGFRSKARPCRAQ